MPAPRLPAAAPAPASPLKPAAWGRSQRGPDGRSGPGSPPWHLDEGVEFEDDIPELLFPPAQLLPALCQALHPLLKFLRDRRALGALSHVGAPELGTGAGA